MKENQENQTEKEVADESKINMISTIIAVIVFVLIIRGCFNMASNTSNTQSDEYWRSIKTEKHLRESGMDREADKIRKYRQENLYE